VVTSLHDGMNLVSKEFVAARDDEQGVLILSRFAGAARELTGGVIVTLSREESADALHRAATMPPAEQRQRMAAAHDRARNTTLPLGRPHARRCRALALRARIEARGQRHMQA